MYGNFGCLNESYRIFNNIRISERDIITCTTMILAFGQHGKVEEAFRSFEQMQQNIKPDQTTIVCVLNACRLSGLVSEGFDIFYNLESKYKYKIKPSSVHCIAMVNLLEELVG
jgi:pentatricopeptide repeat protein